MNKKLIVVGVLGVAIIAGGIFFQNCSKSPNLADYTQSSTGTATDCVSPASLTWSQGTSNCSAAVPVASYQIGQQIQLPAASPATGNATFTCGGDGNFTVALGATCTGGTTVVGGCPEPAAFTWTVAGVTCTAAGTGNIADNTPATIHATTNSGTATFTCTNNILGPATAATCTAAPSITAQPAAVTACEGTPLTLSVTANASTALTYQWYLDGIAIANQVNATTATYTSTISQGANTYYVIVSDATGSTQSSTVTVTGGNPAVAGACPALPSKISACSMNFSGYPAAAGFLLSAIGIGNICCEVSPAFSGQTANGFGFYCDDAPTFTAVAASGPPAPIPAGTSCSVAAAGFPPGGGVISYSNGGVEACCTTATNYPHPATATTVSWYCEHTTTTTGAQTKPPLVNAGTPCNVSLAGYAANRGITLYTQFSERVCCEIGAQYNGPGDGKGFYCEPY